MAWPTASDVINAAAQELALTTSAIADVYASTDANVVQLRALLAAAGQELLRDFPWTQFQREHTFDTVANVAAYELPTDFGRLLDQSGWNRTERFPLAGPVGAQGWQLLKASATTSTFEFYFRIKQNQIFLHPTPTSVETVAFEYVSAWWVTPDGEDNPTTETPTEYDDVLMFDRRLLVTRLKRDFLREKGLDSTAATLAHDAALAAIQGGDGAAPVLNLASAPLALWRPLDGANVPESGLGN